MAKPYELPIIQKDASGNLQRATATNENYLAFKAGVHLAGTADQKYPLGHYHRNQDKPHHYSYRLGI